MTIERKIVVGLEDIEALTLECRAEGCGYRVSFSPDKFERIPNNCGQCGQDWTPRDLAGHTEARAWVFLNLLRSIRTARAFIAENGSTSGFRVLLEFKEPQS